MEIEDFIFEYYYADRYVHDLGIDSDDPNFFLTVKEDNMLVNYYLSYLKREEQRMMNRNKYLNVSTAVYFLVKLGSKN